MFAVVCVCLFGNMVMVRDTYSKYRRLSTPEYNFYIFSTVYHSDTQSKDVKLSLNKKIRSCILPMKQLSTKRQNDNKLNT